MTKYKDYEFTKMPYGKYRGYFIKDLPDAYIKWCILNYTDQAMATMLSIELQRRYKSLR